MQQRRLVGMKRRVEPEPALGGKAGAHADVGDQEAVVENLPFAFEPEHACAPGCARRRRRSASRMRPCSRRRASRREARRGRRAASTPTTLLRQRSSRLRQLAQALDQELLDIVLLQVDERRPVMPALGQQVELVDLLVAEEDLADAPADALLRPSARRSPGDRGSPACASAKQIAREPTLTVSSSSSSSTGCRAARDRSQRSGRPARRRRRPPASVASCRPSSAGRT